MKRLPIGVDDYKHIVDNDLYFVDKTLFIKEVIDDGSQVILITRPRRFGKTLNMSLLKYFFGKSTTDNSICQELPHMGNKVKGYRKEQGQISDTYLTFKTPNTTIGDHLPSNLFEISTEVIGTNTFWKTMC